MLKPVEQVISCTCELVVAGRSVQDSVGSALHCVGAALPGPLPEPAGGPAQREEDAAVLPRVTAHRSSAGLLGHRPAANQDGHFPTKVNAWMMCLFSDTEHQFHFLFSKWRELMYNQISVLSSQVQNAEQIQSEVSASRHGHQ